MPVHELHATVVGTGHPQPAGDAAGDEHPMRGAAGLSGGEGGVFFFWDNPR